MLNIFRRIPCKPSNIFLNYFSLKFYKTVSLFQNASEKTLSNLTEINRILKTNIPKKSKRSQRGLFHGKQTKTGNKTCFSEKKSRRTWKPNTFHKHFFSDVLKKKIYTEVTTKAIKCIRKYGGFDNYILLTKPENLDSIYGEYLRKLMLNKLNNPDFVVPHIAKSREVKHYPQRLKRWKSRPVVWLPKEIRNIDISHLAVKREDQMNKKELKELREAENLSKNFETSSNHPLIERLVKEKEEEERLIEPISKQAIENFEKKVKDKKLKERINKMAEEAQIEFENPPTKFSDPKMKKGKIKQKKTKKKKEDKTAKE